MKWRSHQRKLHWDDADEDEDEEEDDDAAADDDDDDEDGDVTVYEEAVWFRLKASSFL